MRNRNFLWDPGFFNILGIEFSVNLKEIIHLNFLDKIQEMEINLTVLGKEIFNTPGENKSSEISCNS